MDPNTPQPGRIQTMYNGKTGDDKDFSFPSTPKSIQIPAGPDMSQPGLIKASTNPTQPGRLSPIKLNTSATAKAATGKLNVTAGNATSKIGNVAKNPKSALLNRAANVVTAGAVSFFASKSAENRYEKALQRAHIDGSIPTKPTYRVTLVEFGIVGLIAFIIDMVNACLAFFWWLAGIPEGIAIYIDMIFGIIMVIYVALRLRLNPIENWARYVSLLIAFVGDTVPYLNFAAFWTLDVIYIAHTMRAQDRQTFNRVRATILQEEDDKQRQQWMRNFAEQQATQEQDEDETEIESEQNTNSTTGEGRIRPTNQTQKVPPIQNTFTPQRKAA